MSGNSPQTNRWALVGLLTLAAIIAYMDRLILSVLFVPLSRGLSLSDTQMSVLQGGSFAVIYALAGLPLGMVADRLNRRNIIIGGVLLWSGATIAGGFATTFTQLLLSRFVTGIGEAALFPAATSMIGDGVSLQRRGLALSLFVMGQMLGGGAAVTVGGILLDLATHHAFDSIPVVGHLAPWGIVLVLVGSPGAALLLGLCFISEPPRRETAVERSAGTREVLAQFIMRWKLVLPLYLALACAALSDFSIGAWTPTLLSRHFGWSGTQIGVWFGGCLISSGLAAALLAGIISDWARRNQGGSGVLRWAAIAAAIAFACSAFALMPTPPLLLSVLFAQSIASSTCSLICAIAIQVNLPNEVRGLGSALLSLGNILLGLGCGPTLVALATEHLYRNEKAVGASIATVCAPAFVIGTLVLLTASRRSGVQPQPTAALPHGVA